MTHGRDELILQPLDLLALADIEDHPQHQKPAAGVDRIESDFDGKFAAILPPPEQIATGADAPAFGFGREFIAVMGMPHAHPVRHQHVDRLSDQLVARISKLAFEFGVDHDHLAVVIGHHHSARAGLDREPKHFLRETSLDDV